MAKLPEGGKEKRARKKAKKAKKRASRVSASVMEEASLDEEALREELGVNPDPQGSELPVKRKRHPSVGTPFDGKPPISDDAQPGRRAKKVDGGKVRPDMSDYPADVDGRSVSTYLQCSAKSKRTHKRCKARAMSGSDKCYHHGGATPAVHKGYGSGGLLSKYDYGALGDKIQELVTDPDLIDLREELALLKGLLSTVLEKCAGTKNPEMVLMENSDGIVKVTDAIRKTTMTLIDVEKELHMTISLSQMEMYIKQIVTIVRQEIDDDRVRERIAGRLSGLAVPVRR
jgi:hypothetical protein